MKLEQSFEVSAPVERVWQALTDVERVAPCLPGAAVTGRNDDGTYNGTFAVKIGPTTATYAGKLEMESVDESAHTATMRANGTDKRGQGGAKATIFSAVTPVSGGTRVEVSTDYHITGRLARFGRGGMIEDISEQLLREFARRLQESLTETPAEAANGGQRPRAVESAGATNEPPAGIGPQPPQSTARPQQAAEPIEGLSLVSSVLWNRVRRNPAPVAVIAGLVLLLAVLRLRHRFARRQR
jgi:uncharacterized protein